MNKVKTLIFSLVYYPEYVGGAELAIHEIVKRISNSDNVFHMVTLRGNQIEKNETIQGVTIFRVGWKTNNKWSFRLQKIIFPFLAYIKSRSLHKEKNYTHAWSMMANQAGFAGLFFKLTYPYVRFVLTLQEGDPIPSIKRKVFFVYPLFKMIFKKADVVTAISHYLKDFGFSMGAKKVVVIPNGVDLSIFSHESSQEEKEKLLSKLSLQSHHRILVTTSRLVKKNGIEYVIRALSKLPESVVFIILGTGGLKQELQNLAHSLSVAHRVRFVGFVEYNNIPKYFSISHAFIRVSLSEGLGNSFLEAMYFGLPTIGTQAGGIKDFLFDGKTGFVCDPAKEETVVQSITRALGSENTKDEARRLVKERYDWDSIAKTFSRYMRILITTGLYPPEIGGPATYTKLVEQELVKQGHQVTVLPFRKVRHLPPLVRHLVFLFHTLRKGQGCDIWYTQDTVSVGLPTAIGAWLFSKRFFVRVPGDFAWEQGVQRFGVKESIDDFQNKRYGFRVELLRKIQRFVVNRAERVITPSSYFKDLVSNWLHDSSKVSHIYNGIVVGENVVPHTFAKKTLVASGRLVPWKGFDSLISFVATTDFDLMICGDGEDRSRLENIIKEHNLGDRVHLVGRVSREELLAYSAGSYAVIAPSSFESFSFQLVEAMSVGAVCIAFNIGNLDEIITNGVSGYLVPEGDYEAIRAILETLPSVRNVISENAIRVSEHFSIEKTTRELLTCFERPTRVLMISTDRNIFNQDSPVWKRIEAYGTLFKTLDVIVYTKKGFHKKKIGNITLYPTNAPSRWLYVVYALVRAFSLKRPNVVTTQDPFETGVVGFFLSFVTRWNVQIHTDWKSANFQKGFLNKLRTLMGGFIMRRASSIRVVSERIKNSLPDYCKTKKVTVLPIGIYEIRPQRQAQEKEHYTILTVSRLESEKNIELLIRAMKFVSNSTLRIVGDGSLRTQLGNLARDLGVEEKVIFVGQTNDVHREYENADMYVQASSYEGFGMTILEAGLHGLPIVTTDVGLVGYELPKDSLIVFGGKSPEEFADHMGCVLKDRTLRQELSEKVYTASQQLVTSKEEYLLAYRASL